MAPEQTAGEAERRERSVRASASRCTRRSSARGRSPAPASRRSSIASRADRSRTAASAQGPRTDREGHPPRPARQSRRAVRVDEAARRRARDSGPGKQWPYVATALVLAGVSVGIVAMTRSSKRDPAVACASTKTLVASTWNPMREAAVIGRLRGYGKTRSGDARNHHATRRLRGALVEQSIRRVHRRGHATRPDRRVGGAHRLPRHRRRFVRRKPSMPSSRTRPRGDSDVEARRRDDTHRGVLEPRCAEAHDPRR